MSKNRDQEVKFYPDKSTQYFDFFQKLRKTGIHWTLVLALALSACGPLDGSQATPHPEAPQSPNTESTEDVNSVEAGFNGDCAALIAVLINSAVVEIDGSMTFASPEDLTDHVIVALYNIGLKSNAQIWSAMLGCFGEATILSKGAKDGLGNGPNGGLLDYKYNFKNIRKQKWWGQRKSIEYQATPEVRDLKLKYPGYETLIFIPNDQLELNPSPTMIPIPMAPGAETQVIRTEDKLVFLAVTIGATTVVLAVIFFPEGLLILGPTGLGGAKEIFSPQLAPAFQ